MSVTMPNWARQILTEQGDLSYDVLRVIACLGVLVYLSLAVANWRTFEPLAFGTGFGAVLLAAGGAIRINEGPQPGTPPDGPTTTVRAESVTIKP